MAEHLMMTRRAMLSGTAAFLTAPAMFGSRVQPQIASSEPPKRMLVPIFTESMLNQHLAEPQQWEPFARGSDRATWQAVPDDVRSALISTGEKAAKSGWDVLPASLFLGFREKGNRTEYEAVYFRRRQTLCSLVLAECAEGKGRFLRAIGDGLWLICEESFWGVPAHLGMQKAGVGLPDVQDPIIDLFAGDTASTLSVTSYLLGSELNSVSPMIQMRVALETQRRVLTPALQRTDFSWMGLSEHPGHLNNWTPWICSNWIMTNLLMETDRKRQVDATTKACKVLDNYLSEQPLDGGCDEGPGYWSVATGSYLDCVSFMQSATQSDAATLDNVFLQRMVHYIVDAHIAGSYYVNYGDAHPKLNYSGLLLHRLGRIASDTTVQSFGTFLSNQQQRFAGEGQGKLMRDVLDLAEIPKMQAGKGQDALVRNAWYPVLGLMTARQVEGSDRGLYLCVQAAPNARSHGHNDSGSFIVFHNGRPLFIDVGVEAYSALTFSSKRYTLWTMQSAYHNLPLINGTMESEKKGMGATSLTFAEEPQKVSLSMNLASAFPAEARINRWHRRVALDRADGSILLQEEFELQDEVPVALAFMTPVLPVADGANTLRFHTSSQGTVVMKFDGGVLHPTWEEKVLRDAGLRESWGDTIYRVLLSSKKPVRTAGWDIVLRSE